MQLSSTVARGGAGAALALGLLAGGAQAARAQDPQSLHDALFGLPRRDARIGALPALARFRSEDGASFVLDRSAGPTTLLRFSDSPEIWVLRPTPGPRGDLIFRNDLGEPVLRAMRVGGLTVFTPDRPDGSAAALAGAATVLRPSFVAGPQQLLQVLIQASARASRAAGKLIAFEAPDYQPGTELVWADAAGVTAEALVRVASGRPGREVLARFVRVRFTAGRAPNAAVSGQEVRITVSPGDGLAGRPSSRRIAFVISRR